MKNKWKEGHHQVLRKLSPRLHSAQQLNQKRSKTLKFLRKIPPMIAMIMINRALYLLRHSNLQIYLKPLMILKLNKKLIKNILLWLKVKSFLWTTILTSWMKLKKKFMRLSSKEASHPLINSKTLKTNALTIKKLLILSLKRLKKFNQKKFSTWKVQKKLKKPLQSCLQKKKISINQFKPKRLSQNLKKSQL